jgi:hypothetical protein
LHLCRVRFRIDISYFEPPSSNPVISIKSLILQAFCAARDRHNRLVVAQAVEAGDPLTKPVKMPLKTAFFGTVGDIPSVEFVALYDISWLDRTTFRRSARLN